MLVIFSVYRLAHEGVGVCVERPQHKANATKTYRSLQKAKSTLLSFGIAEEVLDECLKLVPQLGESEAPAAGCTASWILWQRVLKDWNWT